MGDVLVVIFAVLAVWAAITALGLWWVLRSLRRTNRVTPDAAHGVPLHWLAVPSRPARLHRRLRNLAAWSSQQPTGTNDTTWAQLVHEVVTTDARLTTATRANGRARPGELDDIAATVTRLEDLAVRLRNIERAAGGDPDTPPPSDALELLEHRIDHLEAAHADLADIERRMRATRGDGPSATR